MNMNMNMNMNRMMIVDIHAGKDNTQYPLPTTSTEGASDGREESHPIFTLVKAVE